MVDSIRRSTLTGTAAAVSGFGCQPNILLRCGTSQIRCAAYPHAIARLIQNRAAPSDIKLYPPVGAAGRLHLPLK